MIIQNRSVKGYQIKQNDTTAHFSTIKCVAIPMAIIARTSRSQNRKNSRPLDTECLRLQTKIRLFNTPRKKKRQQTISTRIKTPSRYPPSLVRHHQPTCPESSPSSPSSTSSPRTGCVENNFRISETSSRTQFRKHQP